MIKPDIKEIQNFMNNNYTKYHHEISQVYTDGDKVIFRCTKWNGIDSEIGPLTMYIDEKSYEDRKAIIYNGV